MKLPETGGTPHNQDHAHFKAVRDEGDFRDATAATSPDMQRRTLPNPDAPDAWKHNDTIFREGAVGGMKALNKRISTLQSLSEGPDANIKVRRLWVAGSRMGKQEINTSDNPDTERTNERLDDQYDGYIRGLQDARKMLSNHIAGHQVWVESSLDGGYSATRDRRQGQK